MIKSDCLDLRFSPWRAAAEPLKPPLTGPVLVKQMGEKGDHHNRGKGIKFPLLNPLDRPSPGETDGCIVGKGRAS